MTWHVQYRNSSADQIARYPSPEKAIEAACGFMDNGCDVYGIGTGPLTDSISKEQIALIYDLWAGSKFSRGKRISNRDNPAIR